MREITNQIRGSVNRLLEKSELDEKIASDFIDRLKDRRLSIDSNPESHFCAYFASYDPNVKQVFMGHHKKSGLWLFNGGHVDEGESLEECLSREMDEEWGLKARDFKIKKLKMLTITKIYNPKKQPCRTHYDLWNFIKVNKDKFSPDSEKLSEEFYEFGWKDLCEAKKLVKGKSDQTLEALNFIEKKYFK